VKIGLAVRAGRVNEKKGQDRTGKKSQKGCISPICGEAPTEAMYMKICVVGDVLDVIMYAKFQNEIFRGYDFTGVRIVHFPIDFEWALQQCSATALPVMDYTAEDKASGVTFCSAVHRRPRQKIRIFVNFASPDTQNRINRPARVPRPPRTALRLVLGAVLNAGP